MTNKQKRTVKRILGIYIPLCVTALFTIAPILWSLITSLKEPGSVFKLPVQYFPSPATLKNFVTVWGRNKFSLYFGNSLYIGVLSVVFIVILAILNGYALARFKFRQRGHFSLFCCSLRLCR